MLFRSLLLLKECDDFIRERLVIDDFKNNAGLQQEVTKCLNYIIMLFKKPFDPVKFSKLKFLKYFLNIT